MTNWRNHLIIGIVLAIVTAFYILPTYFNQSFDLLTGIILVGFAAINSILPDQDIGVGKMRVWMNKGFLGVGLALILLHQFWQSNIKMFFLGIVLIAYVFMLAFARHRAFFHSIKFLLIMVVAVYFFVGLWEAVFTGIGIASHYALDSCWHW